MVAPMMRAARLDLVTGRVTVRDIPRPRPASGELLVRVAGAAVCPTDLAVVRGRLRSRGSLAMHLTLGHQVVGTVSALGSGVNGWPLGNRVAVHPLSGRHEGADRLGIDRDGGWADYVVVLASSVVPLPDVVAFDDAAVLPDGVASAWSAISRAGRVQPGHVAAVWGIGDAGAQLVRLARFVGAAQVIAIDASATGRERGRRAGADAALDPNAPDLAEQVRRAGRGRLPDVAFGASGSPDPCGPLVQLLAEGGTAVLASLSADRVVLEDATAFLVNSQRLVGHWASRFEDLVEVVRLVEAGRFDLAGWSLPVVSLEDAPAVIEDAAASESCSSVILRPSRATETG